MAEPAPRRTPETSERQRDAERSKRRLLEAAFDEFAAHGFAGARVGRIAEAAGVNKQLISYYFGCKEGLYQAMQRSWLDAEAVNANPAVPAADTMMWYLRESLSDPRGVRLLLWQALNDDAPDVQDQADYEREQEWMRRRVESGEFAADLDPEALQLVFMGMTMMPAAMPHLVRQLFGVEPNSEEFIERYGKTLRRVLAALADPPKPPKKGSNP
ncbi:TetR/AcrR family transcriptional regulator [Stackebrandtia nassauensis]|nr:TetR family transcriptional regulator [Stackebrandtia nassauensis]